jgi:hypothetical protein
VLLVIAITVGVTLFVTRGSGGGGTTTPTASDIASANDTGPVSIIAVEPTCASWRPIQNALAATQSNGWGDRDPSTASSAWTPGQRSQYEAVGNGMRTAADQAVILAKQTPHRVMREIYEQFVAYGRAYADSLQSYQPKDDSLSRVNVSFSKTISTICDALDSGSVATRAATLKAADPPSQQPDTGDLTQPARFLTASNSSCAEWIANDTTFTTDTDAWAQIDSKISASEWTPDQRDIQERAATTFSTFADDIEKLGRQSGNGVFEDIATLAALYLRAYSNAIPTYVVADGYLVVPSLRINNAVTYACKATAG